VIGMNIKLQIIKFLNEINTILWGFFLVIYSLSRRL
jgi:hypothetical protein